MTDRSGDFGLKLILNIVAFAGLIGFILAMVWAVNNALEADGMWRGIAGLAR